MNNYLEQIIARKFHEVEQLKKKVKAAERKLSSSLFKNALQKKSLAVIAEIKRQSPSRGQLNPIHNPVDLALQYCSGGAAAISVLTDSAGFGGSLFDLQRVAKAIKSAFPQVAILRKDFVVHPIQLAETAFAGADCVLLIARVLKNKLADFINEASRLGLETLTEVHDENDIAVANDAHAPIIGINHRDLTSFRIDLNLSETLKPLLPATCLSIAESGICSADDAQRMQKLGYDGILVGEALVTAAKPADLIMQMRGIVHAG